VVAAVAGVEGHAYAVEDCSSGRWATRSLKEEFVTLWELDCCRIDSRMGSWDLRAAGWSDWIVVNCCYVRRETVSVLLQLWPCLITEDVVALRRRLCSWIVQCASLYYSDRR
jgi:hypothetical protein